MSSVEMKRGLLAAQANEEVKQLLGSIPPRWGRMSPLSRLLIVELALVLQQQKLLVPGERLDSKGLNIGIIGASRRGSLFTDQAFVNSMEGNSGLASPALFGYTLANIPLAEAALTFGLTGPVYALFQNDAPLPTAEKEARLLLQMQAGIDMMFACDFDHYMDGEKEHFSVEMTIINS